MPVLTKLDPSHTKQIAIFRALQLGDMLHVVPAMRALRAAFPSAHIALVGLPWEEEFVKRFHRYLDEFIRFPGVPGFPEQPARITDFPHFLKEIQSRHLDLAIQMQGSGDIANPLISLWGAKQYAGFYKPGQHCPDPDTFLVYPEIESEVWRHLRLMEFLDIPLQGDDLEFPLFAEDWQRLDRLKQSVGLREEYVCIHPGARRPERRWPVKDFAEVADALAAQGCQIVLTGSADEAELTRAVARDMKTPATDLGGKTELGTLAALISKARLVISNDTGVSHVTAAVKTPSVVLFSIPDMDSWAPKDRQRHRVLWPASETTPADVLLHVEDLFQQQMARRQAAMTIEMQNSESGEDD